MSIPFLDLARLHASIEAELTEAVRKTISLSAFHGGDALRRFERDFAQAHGVPAAAGCGSGTDALSLALRAVGVGEGDEVVLPSNTFIATAEAVVHAGATPVIADVDPVTLLMTPATAADATSDRTRAVIPVHLFGHMVPADHLKEWRRLGLVVVEDAAQAHMASDGESFVGSMGNAGCFSFYPGKNLGAFGDAGMVVSADEDLIARVRKARDHGRTQKYVHDEIGWCSRLDGLQAALLEVKLGHLPEWTAGRRRAAAGYATGMAPANEFGVSLVPWRPGDVHHLMVVRVPAERRDDLVRLLGDVGVGCGIHYPVTLSEQPAMARWHRPTPVAEAAAREIVSLPIDPLMRDSEVEEVCRVVTGWAGSTP